MGLFSDVFENSVTITIVDTIVNGGASECGFEISAYLIMRIIWQWILLNSYKQ